ncbi:hypothetical protein ACFQBS_35870, partial [Planomonospora parontospora]
MGLANPTPADVQWFLGRVASAAASVRLAERERPARLGNMRRKEIARAQRAFHRAVEDAVSHTRLAHDPELQKELLTQVSGANRA